MKASVRLAALSFLVALLGCSSAGSVADAGSVPDGPHSCFEPLSASNWLCAASFAEQVAGHPCDDVTATTQSTCGQYQLWRNTLNVGHGLHACIYDNNQNGALVGGKTCGTADATCTNGCIEYGGVLLGQLMSCGPETGACPP